MPTNLVESTKAKRYYTSAQLADLDIKTSVNKIGDIINLSQELQSLMWDRLKKGESYENVKELYFDICQLDVMSGIEIDKAKKEFAIDNTVELETIKQKWLRRDDDGRVIKPYFFAHIAQTKGYYNPEKKHYMHHATTMDYLEELVDKYRSPVIRGKKIPLTDILEFEDFSPSSVYYPHVTSILEQLESYKNKSMALWSTESVNVDNTMKHQIYLEYGINLVKHINLKINPSVHTLFALLKKLETKEYKDYRNYLSTILFNIRNQTAFQLIQQSQRGISLLIPDANGEVELYGMRYAKTCKN